MLISRKLISAGSAAVTALAIMVGLTVTLSPSNSTLPNQGREKAESALGQQPAPAPGKEPQKDIERPKDKASPVEPPSLTTTTNQPVSTAPPQQQQEQTVAEQPAPVYRNIQNSYPTIDQTEDTPEVFSHPPTPESTEVEPLVEVLLLVEEPPESTVTEEPAHEE